MRIDELLNDLLTQRKAKLADAGVSVVEEPYGEEIAVAVTREQLVKVIGAVIDKALEGIGSGLDRRLVVRSRGSFSGAVVEIEYTRALMVEPKTVARYKRAAQDEDTREITKYRETVAEWGAQVFISSAERGPTRYVIEVPARADSAT